MKNLASLFVIGGLVLTGCNKQAPQEEPEFDRQVTINFNVKPSSSALKSAGTTEEDAIDEITIYGVNVSGNVISTFPNVAISSTGQATLTLTSSVVSLYAIANSKTDMASQPKTTVAELEAMTCDYTNAPESPFVMSGNDKGTLERFTNTASIEMIRSIAKIVVSGGSGGYVVDKIQVNNPRDEGFVFSQSSFGIPSTSFTLTSYPEIASSICYVPENTTASPTTLTVNGKYNGTAIAPLTVHFTQGGGTPIPIERNKCYTVNIKPIGDDFDITITIKEWDDVTVDDVTFVEP